MTTTCSESECDRASHCRGWCRPHYVKFTRPSRAAGRPRPSPAERFWAKVDKNGPVPAERSDLGPCWLWTGATSGNGRYGCFGATPGATVRSHRFSFEEANGPLADGDEPDHLCKVTLCVRPTHLEAVTHRENVLRGNSFAAVNAVKTQCINGHPYTPETTRTMKNGGRQCVACEKSDEGRAAARERTRRHRERKRLAGA